MSRKIYIRKGGISFLSFPIFALFVVLAFFLFAVFGVVILAGIAILGIGVSILRMLFQGGEKRGNSHKKHPTANPSSSITLDKSDYEIKDLD